jgi:hypothetical protein
MAAAEDILELRDMLNEPDDSNGWTDEKLGALIDGFGTLNAAASSGWSTKAARYSELVNVSESGSSRSLGDLFSRAMQMAKYYRDLDDVEDPPVDAGVVIGRIRRGFT